MQVEKTRYTVKVERSDVIETVTTRRWERGGTEGVDKGCEYGYTPQIPLVTTETVNVVEMRLSELDVAALITAVLAHGRV
jgi:hypothetical protein